MMETITIESVKDKFVISLDKKTVNQDFLIHILDELDTERLAQKVGFDESIEEVADLINANWWNKNQHRFINAN